MLAWTFAAMFVLILGAGVRAADDKSLVLQLAFDEGNGTVAKDMSGNGNNGAITGAQWTPLAKGFGLKFDGATSKIEIPNSPTLCMNDGAFTIEIRLRPDDLTKTQTLMSKGMSQEFMIAEGADYGPRTCMFLTDWEAYRYSANIFKAGEWMHVVYVKSQKDQGADLICYANGVVSEGGKGSKAFPALIKPSENSLFIGCANDKWFFNGIIREVKIYKRALSAEEVLAEFNRIPKADLEVKAAAK